MLERSIKAEHVEINKTIRRLRWCSKHGVYSTRPDGLGFDFEASSGSCKNKNCHVCNRNKATKLGLRMSAFFKDEQTQEDIKGFYFYHITFSLKHTKEVRNYIYLDELKAYMIKLFRRKFWKQTFRSVDNWGQIISYENVIKTDHHIHAHALVMGGRLKSRVNLVEKELRKIWKGITDDSTGIHIQMVRAGDLHEKIKEIVKYPLKLDTTDYANFSQDKIELICDWIIYSKGKNFTNAHGYFKSQELTTNKSRWDIERDPKVYDENRRHFIDKIASVWLSIPKGRGLDKDERRHYFKKVVEEIVIVKLSKDAIEVTDHMQYASDMLGIDDFDDVRSFIESMEALNPLNRPFGNFDNDGFTIPMNNDRIREMILLSDLNDARVSSA